MTSLKMPIFCCKCVYMDNGRRGWVQNGLLQIPPGSLENINTKKKEI
jgi:hypothetical protein